MGKQTADLHIRRGRVALSFRPFRQEQLAAVLLFDAFYDVENQIRGLDVRVK